MTRTPRRHERGQGSAGFSLTEMLVTTLILLLLTGLLASGVSFAVTQQRRSVFYSQAGTLQSTVDNALADPVRFMTAQTDGDGTWYTLTYRDDLNAPLVARDPQLVVGDGSLGEKGHLYLAGTDAVGTMTYVKLLNAGAYGTSGGQGGNVSTSCGGVLTDPDGNPASSASLVPDPQTGLVTVRFKVQSATDPTLSSDVVELSYRPVSFEKDVGAVYGM